MSTPNPGAVAHLHVRAAVMPPAQADELVASFRAAVAEVVGRVAPWDRRADPSTLDVSPSQSLWGVLVGSGAECRWRTDADRCAVSIISDRALAGLELREVAAQVEGVQSLEWLHDWTDGTGRVAELDLQQLRAEGAGAVERLILRGQRT